MHKSVLDSSGFGSFSGTAFFIGQPAAYYIARVVNNQFGG